MLPPVQNRALILLRRTQILAAVLAEHDICIRNSCHFQGGIIDPLDLPIPADNDYAKWGFLENCSGVFMGYA